MHTNFTSTPMQQGKLNCYLCSLDFSFQYLIIAKADNFSYSLQLKSTGVGEKCNLAITKMPYCSNQLQRHVYIDCFAF